MDASLNEAGLMMALESLNEVMKSCNRMENRIEAKMSEAESELMTVRKIRGWVGIELDAARKRLMQLREAQQK